MFESNILSALAAAGIFFSSTALVIADNYHHTPNEAGANGVVRPDSAGTNNGATCKVSFATKDSSFTPPDNFVNLTSSPISYLAAGVALVKPCTGTVIATFSSELVTPNSGSFIHAQIRATCIDTGGLTNACTPGQQIFGDPGTTYMETNQQPYLATHSAIWTFPTQARGHWRYEVFVGGDGAAYVDYRTLVVEMFGS